MAKFIMLIAPLTVALMAAPALAHGPHGRGACRQDLHAYCSSLTPTPDSFRGCLATLCGPDFTPGPGAFASCLQNAATAGTITLSGQCTAHLTKMQAKIDAWETACGDYAQKNCTDGTGPRAIGQCLHAAQNTDPNFPPACAALLAQHHRHHHHHGPADPNSGQ
jgi:hypothetical protein